MIIAKTVTSRAALEIPRSLLQRLPTGKWIQKEGHEEEYLFRKVGHGTVIIARRVSRDPEK